MQRYTAKTKYGNILDADISIRGDCKTYCKAIDRLAEYEDLGLTPEQIKTFDKLYLEKCVEVNKLKTELEKHKWVMCREGNMPEDILDRRKKCILI